MYNQYINYTVDSDFSVKIKGTSNVHDWESSVKNLSGTANVLFSESGELKIEDCKITIPVKSIKSTKGSMMDKKTWKALKAKSHSNIEYSLTSFKNVKVDGSNFSSNATGQLTIAGTTKRIDMDVKGKILNNRNIEITGSKDLKMTDFNINPPTALLGTMTTGDQVTIEFKVTLNSD